MDAYHQIDPTRHCQAPSPPKSGRVTYWDRMLPSFGLQITTNDARSWNAAYRVHRRLVIETLGSLVANPAEWRMPGIRAFAFPC